MTEAREWIQALSLEPHPEGGWFRETYRSEQNIGSCCLSRHRPGARSLSTAILYLLEAGDCSAFHRIRSDEIWHHHGGSTFRIHVLDAGGHHVLRVGADLASGALPQAVVPGGAWFAAEIEGDGWGLAGCTVAPGFEFEDFELADRRALENEFPEHAELVRRLAR